jgi:hypothetical protein
MIEGKKWNFREGEKFQRGSADFQTNFKDIDFQCEQLSPAP